MIWKFEKKYILKIYVKIQKNYVKKVNSPLGGLGTYNVPLFACSLSILSNNALKFPAPKPLAPMR